jgi:vesicle coat complex subunit
MSGYFTEYKRGEINDLRNLLRETSLDRNEERQRDAVKKVIACMTLGMDVSSLFSEMIMASNTHDLVQKKLVYLYLCHHATEHPDTALLCINTLQKDCGDDSPMVRGLALRSLCSLRLPSLIEHILVPLKSGLVDVSPYVRKTAAAGCAKVFHFSPESIREPAIINKLYELLRDKDPQVMLNAALALEEILSAKHSENGQEVRGSGIVLNQKIALHFFDRLKYLDQWGQCLLLELLTKYQPEPDEIFPIMNLLDERLKTTNVGVVFAIVKLFLKYTESMPEVHKQVIYRVKEPLLLLMSTQISELQYAILAHIKLLISRVPDLFSTDYKRFFCRYNDPTYVKLLKLDILQDIADYQNSVAIIDELTEYTTDLNPVIAKRAVQVIGRIGERVSVSTSHALKRLQTFIDPSTSEADTPNTTALENTPYSHSQTNIRPHLQEAAIFSMKDMIRKYPDLAEEIIPQFVKFWSNITDPDTKAVMVWLLGEYGENILESPYILEAVAKNFLNEEPQVQLQLLRASVCMFFKRPPEVKPWLGELFNRSINQDLLINDEKRSDGQKIVNPSVRDRALFLYNLLKSDINTAQKIISALRPHITDFVEDQPLEIKDRLFEEFNSLSVIYNLPSERFIVATPPSVADEDVEDSVENEAEEPPAEQKAPPSVPPSSKEQKKEVPLKFAYQHTSNSSATPHQLESQLSSTLTSASTTTPAPTTVAATATTASSSVPTSSKTNAQPSPMPITATTTTTTETTSPLPLKMNPVLDPRTFENNWKSWPLGANVQNNVEINYKQHNTLVEYMESKLKQHRINSVAKGLVKTTLKFYSYAQEEATSQFILAEIIVELNSGALSLKLKSQNGTLAKKFAPFIEQLVKSILSTNLS